MKLSISLFWAALIGGLAAHSSAQSIPAGEKISFFAWKRTAEQSVNYGYYGLAEVAGSQSQGSSETINAVAEIQGMPKWLELITDRYADTRLIIDERKPATVVNCSDKYDACPWIRSIRITLDGGPRDCRFEFPLLARTGGFNQYDYFTITVDDSLDLQFHCVEDNVLMGSFLNTNYRSDPDKWLAGKAAVRALIDTAAMLGIGTIELDGRYRGLLQKYLGIDLDEFDPDADFYGIDFLDTALSSSAIRIENFSVSGVSPRQADSIYALSWDFRPDETVAFCSLFVSLDNAASWQPVARLSGAAEAYNWTAPPLDADSAFLELRAYDGARGGSARSDRFAIAGSQPFSLSARAISSSSVELAWNPQALSASARAVCIAWSSAAVPASVSGDGTDSLLYPLSRARDTLAGLAAGRLYYFAAFTQDAQGVFGAAPAAVDSAIIADMVAPVNVYALTVAGTDTNAATLTWQASGALDPDAKQLGLWYSRTRYPARPGDDQIIEIGTFPLTGDSHTVTGLTVGGAYYFSLFVGDSAGNWSGAPAAARARAFLGAGDRGAVALAAGDSVSLFQDSIALVASQQLTTTIVDTLDPWDASSVRTGFVALSGAYAFRGGDPAAAGALSVDIVCTQMPADVSANAVRLYQFDLDRGVWLLGDDPGSYSAQTGRLRAALANPDYPFAVMVDTLAPSLVCMKDFDAVAYGFAERVFDTVTVSDNTGSAAVRLVAGPGGDAPIDFSLYVTELASADANRRFQTIIPPYVADECAGLRAYLIADDGVNRDTINISRRIRRQSANCDNRTVTPAQWTPLIVSAQPENSSVSSLFARSTGAGTWRYDQNAMRLIQWDANEGDWLEYGQEQAARFALAPGALFWVKSRTAIDLDYGDATTLSLHDTLSITLAPNAWTDFGAPYAFDLVLRDMLRASSGGESIELYAWKAAGASYRTDPLFIGDMPGLNDSTIILSGKTGYTIYNASGNESTLRLPPVCAPLSMSKRAAAHAKTARAEGAGSIRFDIVAADGESLSPIYCGFSDVNKPVFYTKPPSFGSQYAAIVKPETGGLAGHALTMLEGGGAAYEIALGNDAAAPRALSAAIGERVGAARTMRTALFDAETGEWLASSDTLRATIASGDRHTAFVVAGTDDFFRGFEGNFQFKTMALRGVYPNPFAGAFKIALTVPFRGVESLELMLYDLRGRRIWRAHKTEGLTPGMNAVVVRDRFHSGTYVLRIRAKIAGEAGTRVFTRLVTCAR